MRTVLTALLVLLGAFLLFWRLDGALLWRDECSTANWAQLMVEKGHWTPKVFDDGQLIVQAADGHDFDAQLTPTMQSWLQFYVAAGAFKVLGVNTWTARLPFALLGTVCLVVLYRLGIVLFGPGLRPFLVPYLGLLSIYFLSAARQSRYYVLVILASSLLFLEVCRYLKNPSLASQLSFYVRLGLAGLLLYFSNYLSFVGMWIALVIFIFWEGDRRLKRRFLLLSAIMAPVLAADFVAFHLEFVNRWLTSERGSLREIYHQVLIVRGRDFWRMTPLVCLVPAAFYLWRRKMTKVSRLTELTMAVGIIVPLSPLLFNFSHVDVLESDLIPFLLLLLASLTVPATLIYCWTKLSNPGLWARAALLAGLVLLVSPLFAIAVGESAVLYRHYYQVVPATVLLGALTTAGLERTTGKKVAAPVFLGLMAWPNINFYVNGFDQVVERQLLNDRTYNEPIVQFLKSRVLPGDKLAVFRNVKGMMLYFYLPEIRWVGQLDSSESRNESYRQFLPADQFDDYERADWFVVWDAKGEKARGLTNQFEKVWEGVYSQRQSWWDRELQVSHQFYEIYRRREPSTPSFVLGDPATKGL